MSLYFLLNKPINARKLAEAVNRGNFSHYLRLLVQNSVFNERFFKLSKYLNTSVLIWVVCSLIYILYRPNM